MKRVTFSPNLTTYKEYNSPYHDPSFMGANDDDAWRHCLRKYYAIKLNYIEEVSLKYIAYN